MPYIINSLDGVEIREDVKRAAGLAKGFRPTHVDDMTEVSSSAPNGSIVYNDDDEAIWIKKSAGWETLVGGGTSDSYIIVKGTGTPAQNGTELEAAYNLAKTLTPAGSSLGSTNRVTILVYPGTYRLPDSRGTYTLDLNTDYIDIVSITGETDVIFDISSGDPSMPPFVASANDFRLSGISTISRPFTITSFSSSYVIRRCKGGDYSFGTISPSLPFGLTFGTANGTFIECTGGYASFGYVDSGGIMIGGYFIDCSATTFSFGASASGSAWLTGTWVRCKASSRSFGVTDSGSTTIFGTLTDCYLTDGGYGFGSSTGFGSVEASGRLVRCMVPYNANGEGNSFGYSASGSVIIYGAFIECSLVHGSGFGACDGYNLGIFGEFIDCTSGGNSFGFSNNTSFAIHATSIFRNCISQIYSFGCANSGNDVDIKAGSLFEGCKGGDYSFGWSNIATSWNYSTSIRCQAGAYSFGTNFSGASILAGTFIDCTAGASSFGSSIIGVNSDASGTFTRCLASNNSFGFTGTASGIFTDCKAESNSFGYTSTGTFIRCEALEQSFGANMSAGTYYSCTGSINSWFGGGSGFSGYLYWCRITSGSFPSPAFGQQIILCIDGSNSIITV